MDPLLEGTETDALDEQVVDTDPTDIPQGDDEETLLPDNDEGGDDSGETEQATDEWAPPSREEWEAMQAEQATMKELLGDNFENVLKGEADDTPPPIAQDELQALLTPREFSVSDDLRSRILIDGDGDALVEFATGLIETVQHNSRIEMNKAVLNGIDYAMPIVAATSKFYDKYPELSGMRNLVKKTMYEARAAMPSANEMQILRAVEKRLGSVIETAKKIAKQHGNAAAAKRNLAPKAAAGTATTGRTRTSGAPRQEETAASRLAELARFQSQ